MPTRLIQPGEQLRAGKTYPEKVCDNCGEKKNVQYFPKRSGFYKKYKLLDPRRYDNQCKKCRKPLRPGQVREELPEVNIAGARIRKGWRTRRKNQRSKRSRLTRREYKLRTREETRVQSMIYLATKGCEECGERDPRKLEYDHKKPADKIHNIADLISHGYSWTAAVLSTEVKKCRVICASCHRVHTIKQQGYYPTDRIQETLGKLAARYRFTL